LGILFVLGLSRQIELHAGRLGSLFRYLGNISLIILLFHVPIQDSWGQKVLALTGNLPVAILAGFLMGVLGPLLIHEIFVRFNPIASYWFGRKAEPSAPKPVPTRETQTAANPPGPSTVEWKEQ
jgi:peptidoglycan/LPS O-acetylase OafA/YrhL